jgi:hypothetical protein
MWGPAVQRSAVLCGEPKIWIPSVKGGEGKKGARSEELLTNHKY